MNKVTVGGAFTIMCNATGDTAPHTTTPSPWFHDGKVVKTTAESRIIVTTVQLQDPTGIMSSITFATLTTDQLGNYTCQAGSKSVIVTLVKAGKWTVNCQYVAIEVHCCVVLLI